MQFEHYRFLIQWGLICIQLNLISASPMIGENVRPAREGEFDFVVAIKKINDQNPNLNKDLLCTGSLISRIDVLTLEHCFKFCPPNHSEIIIGSIDLERGKKFYPAKMITYHMWAVKKRLPFFQRNDIVVVKLTKAVPDEIKPVALSLLKYPFASGLDIVAAGWGENKDGVISTIMETVELKVISSIECIEKLKNLQVMINSLHIKFICTIAEPFAIMCGGNSGGPILHMGKLIGVHQGTCPYPDEPAHPNKINLNLSTDYFKNFILDVINNAV